MSTLEKYAGNSELRLKHNLLRADVCMNEMHQKVILSTNPYYDLYRIALNVRKKRQEFIATSFDDVKEKDEKYLHVLQAVDQLGDTSEIVVGLCELLVEKDEIHVGT